jgi:hypothetical protein
MALESLTTLRTRELPYVIVRVQGLEPLNPKMCKIGNALAIDAHSMVLLMDICHCFYDRHGLIAA